MTTTTLTPTQVKALSPDELIKQLDTKLSTPVVKLDVDKINAMAAQVNQAQKKQPKTILRKTGEVILIAGVSATICYFAGRVLGQMIKP